MNAGARNVLMIVPAFPPDNTSATSRPMHFARNLAEFGYWPLVLVQSGLWSYPQDEELLQYVDGRCEVFRAVGLAKKPLRWCIAALRAGLRIHRQRGIDLVWSTSPSILLWYPAMALSVITATPLVLDVRDPVTYGCLWRPKSRLQARARRLGEHVCLSTASRIVHASPLTMRIMGERAGSRVANRMVSIPNGFSAEPLAPIRDMPGTRCTFLYAGKLERGVREPGILLQGLKIACRNPAFARDACLEVAGGLGEFLADVTQLGLRDNVRDLGYRSRRECSARMLGADVLVLLQSISGLGDDVISGKAYEYLAARRPILGVVSSSGGDAWLLHETRNGRITGLTDAGDVADGFLHFWRLWQEGSLSSAAASGNIDRFDRRTLTAELASVFDRVLAEGRGRRGRERP
jgi:glycosyltransferase involved in cell wall biosynthesis